MESRKWEKTRSLINWLVLKKTETKRSKSEKEKPVKMIHQWREGASFSYWKHQWLQGLICNVPTISESWEHVRDKEHYHEKNAYSTTSLFKYFTDVQTHISKLNALSLSLSLPEMASQVTEAYKCSQYRKQWNYETKGGHQSRRLHKQQHLLLQCENGMIL